MNIELETILTFTDKISLVSNFRRTARLFLDFAFRSSATLSLIVRYRPLSPSVTFAADGSPL